MPDVQSDTDTYVESEKYGDDIFSTRRAHTAIQCGQWEQNQNRAQKLNYK